MASQTQSKHNSGFFKKAAFPLPSGVIGITGVNEKVKRILKDVFIGNNTEIRSDYRFKEDLGLDSLDMVELVMICEKEFFINLPDRELGKSKTVADLEALILHCLKS